MNEQDENRIVADMQAVENYSTYGGLSDKLMGRPPVIVENQKPVENLGFRDRLSVIWACYQAILPIALAYIGGFTLLIFLFMLVYWNLPS